MKSVMPLKLSNLLRSEDGFLTVLSLYCFIIASMIGALAVDYSYLQATKSQLQVAADQAAHAALYNRIRMPEEEAKNKAIDVIQPLLPEDFYGRTIVLDDIEFGTFDRNTAVFTVNSSSKTAVRVNASMLNSKGNPASSYLSRMLGIYHFDVDAVSVFVTYRPGCLREGLMAEGVVDLQSNNSFSEGFCVHSNEHVSINQNNYFEPGTVVSMPNIDDLDMPRSGFEKNDGLQQALRDQRMNLNILNRFDEIERDLVSGTGEYVPKYIDSTGNIWLHEATISQDMLIAGRIHRANCGGSTLTIDGATAAIENVVIITDCQIKFANGSKVENSVIMSKNTSQTSISAPQGLQIGRNDNCADGGGAQIVTLGGVSVASKLAMFGGQILALKDVDFAANADGLQGASIITKGAINGTSNSRMGFCLSGMEDNFEVDYFRMAQ